MVTFLKKVLRFLVLPIIIFVLLVAGYIVYDPFKVVQSYDRYSSLQVNRGYISTEMFLKNYKKENYNSFIFGSSRIFGYNIDSWKQHLGADAKVYSFDAYGEKIQGMYHKLRFLDSLDIDIKNALIAIDVDFTFNNTLSDPWFLYVEHPSLSRESWYDFHKIHFLSYLDPGFIISLYANRIFGINNSYTRKHYYTVEATFDPKTNRPFRSDLEKRIENEPDYYDSPLFYTVTDSLIISPFTRIDPLHKEALRGIKEILLKHNTKYKVVINPLYSQVKFNPKDMEVIWEVFGSDNVYDFSGRNKFTTSKYNYYEESHFRPFIGDSIMNIIYGK
ncbi:hypothetical protein CLV62_103152 [Dysgonomonas alginatilytica]|uniref:Uncharacterized protein n=1 Tax=Dysgonomonas alginatilytica TaxID=1605892 RepID=A0A2V3PS15_9BACT|nr:hypothetical protein [Dysgonomonas alginatilytica]PXV67479.1 hypothetical protein CLV62_103152 [Dysgonomonas alginatilytica]